MSDMETSVLRTVSEYPSALVTLPDIKYEIPDDAKALFHQTKSAIWNKDICGDIVTEVIHDGLSGDFLTHGYAFDKTQADRWVQALPNKNSHVSVYNVKLRLKYQDPDYAAVYTDVPFKLTVLPCEIKRTVPTGIHGTLPIYTATIVDQYS